MRILIVGSGLAGLFAAVRAVDAGHEVTVVTKGALAESNTAHAQGGIAAALFPDDSADTHLFDTLVAGAGLCDADAVSVLVHEGPARVRDLIRFGVAFDRDRSGLARGLEAAHSRSRVLHAGGDATGAAIERAMIATLRRRSVRVLEHTTLVDLVTDAGAVVGAEVLDSSTDSASLRSEESAGAAAGNPHDLRSHGAHRLTLLADAVVLATGGAGQLFRHTTNPAGATGDGVAAAWRAGGRVENLEFVQFHPTALAIPGTPLVSEAVRGDGAVLRNDRGERFLLDVHPLAELAPRDVVARAIAVEMAVQGGAPVLLDATAIGRSALEKRFPTITAACAAAGYDWARQPVPVSPAAHYWMGGIATDLWGRTSLDGLYAIGECACTGVHGANRLASNSLLEAAVFADRAVRALSGGAPSAHLFPSATPFPTAPSYPIGGLAARHAVVAAPPAGVSSDDSADSSLRARIQQTLWQGAGVLRSGDGLRAARDQLATLERPQTATDSPSAAPAVARVDVEDGNLLDLARLLVDAALAREESRGAHYRSDFPSTDAARDAPGHDARAPGINARTPGHDARVPSREDALAC